MLDNACIRKIMIPISEDDEIDVGGLYLDENEKNTVHLHHECRLIASFSLVLDSAISPVLISEKKSIS
jgi:hypothetical protein